MFVSFTAGLLFSRLNERQTFKPTLAYHFGYSLTGIIWLFRELRDLNDKFAFAHPSLTPSSSAPVNSY